MKYVYALILLAGLSVSAQAQVQPGDWATPFTLTDINGNEQRLYDFLSEGKPVIMVMSAAWCLPCWNLHNSGVLEEIYATYGPDGTDEIMVLFIEADPNTSFEQLTGMEGPSQGNWVSGTPYPIIDVQDFGLPAAYGLQAYPTVAMICPDMRIKIPQMWSGLSNWTVENVLNEAFSCNNEPLPNDAAIHEFSSRPTLCGTADVAAKLYNSGASVVNSAEVSLLREGQVLATTTWAGELPTGAEAPIVFEGVPLAPGFNAFRLELSGIDDDPGNNSVNLGIYNAPNTTLTLNFYAQGDEDAAEDQTRWLIINELQDTVASGLIGLDYQETSISLPAEGCYEFVVADDGENGLSGGGFILATDLNGNPIMDASDNFASERRQRFFASTVVSTQHYARSNAELELFPNPASHEVQLRFGLPSEGAARLSLFNANGQEVFSRTYTKLPSGTQQLSAPCGALPNGWYTARLQTTAGTLHGRFIKQ